MKNILLPVIALLFLLACTDSEKTTSQSQSSEKTTGQTTEITRMPETQAALDTAKARQELNAIADEIHRLFKKKDIAFIDKHMARDGIYLGTDPGEILNYNDFRTVESQMFRDTTVKIPDYKIDRRKIVINGPSAIIIDQFLFPSISEKMMLRTISHARHENGKWLIDLFSWNFIPKNEDVAKINKAL